YLSCMSLVFFDDPALPLIFPLSLHDALPILCGVCWFCADRGARPLWRARPCACPARRAGPPPRAGRARRGARSRRTAGTALRPRSEEHTSELQSRENLVCRLLLEKKNIMHIN